MNYLEGNLLYLESRNPSLRDVLVSKLKETPIRVKAFPSAHLNPADIAPCRTILILGVGDGALIKKMSQAVKDKNLKIAVFEKSLDLLIDFLKVNDLSQMPPINWFAGRDMAQIGNQIHEYFHDERNIQAVNQVARVECFFEEDRPYYDEIIELFSSSARKVIQSVLVSPEDAYRGLLNVVRNLSIIPDVSNFDIYKNAFEGRAGVVVSTGPSLDQTLFYLKANQDKFVIFCVDSALGLLLQAGIEPHFVACTERVPETRLLFSDIKGPLRSTLVAHPLVVPETLSKYPGPLSFMGRTGSFMEWFLPWLPVHDYGLSASHMAYYGLHLLGCTTILLCGQDLAFHPDKPLSHATNAPRIVKESTEPVVKTLRETTNATSANWVTGNDGNPILSWKYYIDFIHKFENLIWKTQRKTFNVIDQKFGARIPGAEWISPESAFTSFPTLNLDLFEIISEISNGEEGRGEERKSQVASQIAQAVLQLERDVIPDLLKRMNENSVFYQYHLPTAYKKEYEKQYVDWFERTEKADAALNQDLTRAFAHVISPFIIPEKTRVSVRVGQILSEQTSYDQKLPYLFDLIQEYVGKQLEWSTRVLHLLRTISK